MKKGLFRNINNIMTHLIPLYERTDNLLLADFFLTWNDLVPPNNENVRLSQKNNVPALIMEHGMKAVSDYQIDLKDIAQNMGGKPFTADHMMLWGEKSKEIMIEAGIPESKLTVVGSPIVRDYNYRYKTGDEEQTVPFNAGHNIIDPVTKRKWELQDCTVTLPQRDRDAAGNLKGKLIIFMPYHDWTKNGIEQTRIVYEKIKDTPHLLVAASSAYANEKPDNPFKEILKEKNYNKRIEKILLSDIRKPANMELIKGLFRRARLVITTIPGTINGVAWAMDVPTLVPKIDWNWRSKDAIVYDIHPSDYSCDVDDLPSMIDSILKEDTKTAERLEYAKYFMGIDKGNPIENMRQVIEGVT